METRVQRAFQNRWVATAATIAFGYIGVWVTLHVGEGAYYDYYLYPRIKGAEYTYPELRYTLGQAAMLIWSLTGVYTAALAGRCTLFRSGAKWAARSAIAFALGFILLVVGSVAGMAMRDLGF
jgi:hypothetical protein